MRPYAVTDVIVDKEMNPVVLLVPCLPPNGSNAPIPVWVGLHEAALISIAVNGDRSPSPLTHDLVQMMLEALDSEIDRVELLPGGGTLYDAAVLITSPSKRIRLECRPADALALAVRSGLPVHVDELVITRQGLDRGVGVEAQVADFRLFLDEADPRDFRR